MIYSLHVLAILGSAPVTFSLNGLEHGLRPGSFPLRKALHPAGPESAQGSAPWRTCAGFRVLQRSLQDGKGATPMISSYAHIRVPYFNFDDLTSRDPENERLLGSRKEHCWGSTARLRVRMRFLRDACCKLFDASLPAWPYAFFQAPPMNNKLATVVRNLVNQMKPTARISTWRRSRQKRRRSKQLPGADIFSASYIW